MESLSAGDLTIEAVAAGEEAPIQLLWRGKSNDRQPGKTLAPYFKGVVAEALARKVAIEMHFEKLEHFNSSTITSIIQLIQDARAKVVKLVIVYDRELKWQKLSFDALKMFAKDELLELRSK